MTNPDYDKLKVEIVAFEARLDSFDDDVGNDEEIDTLWGFVRQLQDIIESANTEPERVEFGALNRGDRFRFPGSTTVHYRVSSQGRGYERSVDPLPDESDLQFISGLDVMVERVS